MSRTLEMKAVTGKETRTDEDRLFEVVSYTATECGCGEHLTGSAEVTISIFILSPEEMTMPVTKKGRTIAEALFSAFSAALLLYFPELDNISLVCSDEGMAYQSGRRKLPIEAAFSGSIKTVIWSMERALEEAIRAIRNKNQ